MTGELSLKLRSLPDSPGCYLMKSHGKIIYVGKAKNLKNRVSQYFHNSRDHTPKVRAMVEKVDDFDVVLVDSELEALILECNLIKLHRPWYNILLKDDKHYPYIRIDPKADFATVDLVRRPEKDGARYFGPFFSATVVRELLDVVRLVFPIRTCRRAISPDRPTRPCVQYEIGQCVGPCTGNVTPEAYRELIGRVIRFLEGDEKPILRELTERMKGAAAQMQYEKAGVYRDRIAAVEQIMQKQKAIVAGGGDQDVIVTQRQQEDALVQMLLVRGGKMIGSELHVIERAGDEPEDEILLSFMLQYYGEDHMPAREILIGQPVAEVETLAPLLSEKCGRKVVITQPQRGEKRQLVDMAMKNLRDAALKRERRLANAYSRTLGALHELQEVLGIENLPLRIEGYDISNTQGAQSVGSMVVMKGGLSSNKDYRIFRIRTVEGPNDFASMHEVITRRLTHGLKEREERLSQGLDPAGGKFSELPDLILIDGGRGQLNAALEAMRECGLSIPMFGLAKRVEEIVLPDEETSIFLDRHSEALHLIQRLRDEAHRFAITHHRSLRSSAALSSRLDAIPGIGPARKRALLTHFTTIQELLAADEKALCQVDGVSEKTAALIWRALHGEET
ncbi:MAG: excinuclease ABC subunit UvrC [bacterium]|nr:excinuclease ABC subunit UvrC [bacterium]